MWKGLTEGLGYADFRSVCNTVARGVPKGGLGGQQETAQPVGTGDQLVLGEGTTNQSPMRRAISWKVSHLLREWLRTWR